MFRLIGKINFPMAQFSDNLAAIVLSLRMFGRNTVERINKKLIIYSVWNLNERGEEHYLEKYHKLSRICDDNWFMSFCSGNSSGCACLRIRIWFRIFLSGHWCTIAETYKEILDYFFYLFKVKLICFIILILLILRYCSFYR